MKPNPLHLKQQATQQAREQEQASLHPTASTEQKSREFASVEELLRHDAAQTKPPAELADRVKRAIAAEPRPKSSWWQRMFGR